MMLQLLLSLFLTLSTPSGTNSPSLIAANNHKVEIIVSNDCPNCVALEEFLQAKGIEYKRWDLDHDPAAVRLYRQLGGGGIPISRVRGRIIKGFDPLSILAAYKYGW